MILKLLAKAMGAKKAKGAGYCPGEDERVKRLIAAKMSVRNIQAAIEEDKREKALERPLEVDEILDTSETSDTVTVPGIEVEELTQEEAEALLEMTHTIHVEDMVDEDPVFILPKEENSESGVHFGNGVPGIEVVEFEFTPDTGIDFDGDSDQVLTAWGAFSLGETPAVEEEDTNNDWDDIRVSREEAMFTRGES